MELKVEGMSKGLNLVNYRGARATRNLQSPRRRELQIPRYSRDDNKNGLLTQLIEEAR